MTYKSINGVEWPASSIRVRQGEPEGIVLVVTREGQDRGQFMLTITQADALALAVTLATFAKSLDKPDA